MPKHRLQKTTPTRIARVPIADRQESSRRPVVAGSATLPDFRTASPLAQKEPPEHSGREHPLPRSVWFDHHGFGRERDRGPIGKGHGIRLRGDGRPDGEGCRPELPMILFSTGGEARMDKGVFGLIQMAGTRGSITGRSDRSASACRPIPSWVGCWRPSPAWGTRSSPSREGASISPDRGGSATPAGPNRPGASGSPGSSSGMASSTSSSPVGRR